MKQKIIDKGKYYSVPLSGYRVSAIDMRSSLGLELTHQDSRSPELVIDIHMEFDLTRFNQTERLQPYENETIKKAIDLIGSRIQRVECSKQGYLHVTFEDQSEITVPDQPYESWHICKIVQKQVTNTWVIGGVGHTSYFLG